MAPGEASQVMTALVPERAIFRPGRYLLFTINPLSEFAVNPSGRLKTGPVEGNPTRLKSERPSARASIVCSVSVPGISQLKAPVVATLKDSVISTLGGR